MSPEQKGPDPKSPDTGLSGRESVFDRRLREYRNTGGMAKPQRKTLQFQKNPTAEFEIPSLDSRTQSKSMDSGEITEIERIAFYDESSGLLNARTIMSKIATEMRRSARYKHNFSVLIIEVDGLSGNPTLTPLAAEMVFANFAKVIGKNIREVDMLGRFDTSSVMLVCPETSAPESIVEAERLKHVIAHTQFRQVGHHSAVTVSIGTASYPGNGNAPVDMLGAAMEAVQHAVASGGNCIYSARTEEPQIEEKKETFSVDAQDFSPSKPASTAEDMSPTGANPVVFPAADISTILP